MTRRRLDGAAPLGTAVRRAPGPPRRGGPGLMSFYDRAVVALRDVVPERPLLEPPREPAAERLAEVDAAFAPERAPVAAALGARRAPVAALRAVLRAEAVRLDELPRLDE